MLRRTFLPSLAAPLLADTAPPAIFDGKSLDGWSIRQGPESAFYVEDGAIVVHRGSNFPAWLRYDRVLENFDFRCEFSMKGWTNSGVYLHAPEHGRPTECGMKINLFHKREEKPIAESAGSVFPVAAPRMVNVKGDGEWNRLRIRMDWPRLEVWINGEVAQDLDVEGVPALRDRLRYGYLGFESLSYPIRFRDVRLQELPGKEKWETLYGSPDDFAKWEFNEGEATWERLGPVLRGDGRGHLMTRASYRDFELHAYIRSSRYANGGVLFRSTGKGTKGPGYEIQLHDVEGAVYPTGSLYGLERARVYPKIEPEEWFLFQLKVEGPRCAVRINGDTVVDYPKLDRTEAGRIMLQAHQDNRWIEYKQIRVKRLG